MRCLRTYDIVVASQAIYRAPDRKPIFMSKQIFEEDGETLNTPGHQVADGTDLGY